MKYQLGYVGSPLPGDEHLRGSISIPYLSPSGVVSMKFRVLNDGGAKYIKHKGHKNRLFNTGAYFSAGEVLGISEGELDAISATEFLNVPTIGVPGVEGWKESWRYTLRDFSIIYLFADGDLPGRGFAAEMAERIGWRARVIPCAEGEDVSSMVASGRVAELLSLINSTSNYEDES